MIWTPIQSFRRKSSRVAFVLLVLCALALSLAACGGDAPAAQTTTSSITPSAVAISEQTGGQDVYAFAPLTITIKAGGAIKFTNNSDENHKLAVTPTGPTIGTVTRSGSNDNTFSMTFPTAGTYTITSQLVDRLKDGKHTPDPADSKATLTVTVQ